LKSGREVRLRRSAERQKDRTNARGNGNAIPFLT
jgi:hypothetical protein